MQGRKKHPYFIFYFMPKHSDTSKLHKKIESHIFWKLKQTILEADAGLKEQVIFARVMHVIGTENLQIFVNFIEKTIDDYSLSKLALADLSKNMSEIFTFINPHIQTLSHQIIEDIQANQDTDRDYVFPLDELKEQLTQSLDRLYAPVDHRKYDDNGQLIRRFDSLARLFSLNNKLSVCTAASFYNNKLMISLNLNHTKDSDQVIDLIYERFRIICVFISKMQDEELFTIRREAEKIVDVLSGIGGATLNRKVMLQALIKLTYSITIDDTLFNDEFKAVFRDPEALNLQIMLPVLDQSTEKASIRIIHANGTEEHHHLLPPKKCSSIRYLHAEQLIGWYVFILNKDSEATQALSQDNTLNIGVSKLCCTTCKDNLAPLAITVRGTHSQTYAKVVNIIDPSITPQAPSVVNRGTKTFATCSDDGTIGDNDTLTVTSTDSNQTPLQEHISQQIPPKFYSPRRATPAESMRVFRSPSLDETVMLRFLFNSDIEPITQEDDSDFGLSAVSSLGLDRA